MILSIKKKLELAWAAGFYDGEGSTKKQYSNYFTKAGLVKKPTTRVCMSLSQSDLWPLKRFLKAIGNIGRINGPYQYKGNKRPYWVWSISGAGADKVFKMLKPYLGKTKKKQFNLTKKLMFEAEHKRKAWIYDEK